MTSIAIEVPTDLTGGLTALADDWGMTPEAALQAILRERVYSWASHKVVMGDPTHERHRTATALALGAGGMRQYPQDRDREGREALERILELRARA